MQGQVWSKSIPWHVSTTGMREYCIKDVTTQRSASRACAHARARQREREPRLRKAGSLLRVCSFMQFADDINLYLF